MADIQPVGSQLPTIKEYNSVNVTFSAILDATESLVSLNIIDSRPNKGITVNQSTFTGQYRDSFRIGSGSIVVRLRRNGEIKGFDSWDSLPPAPEADIIEWNAPQVLSTDYWYDVELKYLYTPVTPDPPVGPTPPSEEKTLVKRYTQTVVGDWSVWAQQLRDYVKASGPYPK
ncbi:MAG: hypothetical protein ACRCWQ_02825 [Bacilli bacterium]